MSDNQNNKLTPSSPPGSNSPAKQGGTKFGMKTGLHARIAAGAGKREELAKAEQAAQAQAEVQASMAPNRIALLLDTSGSMYEHVSGSESKIGLLRKAAQGFVEQCDLANGQTAVGLRTFPYREWGGEDTSGVSLHPTAYEPALLLEISKLDASGGTPMAKAVEFVIGQWPITRAVLISDGDADSTQQVLDAVRAYSASETPIDCIHIGASHGGEELLKQAAQLTGGVYMKFTDVGKFAESLKYLTPKHRAYLTSGQASAASLGADEIKYLGGK